MKANDEIKKVSWIKTNWLFLLIGVTIGGYLLWAIWYWQCHPSEAGQFGDMFGAVTSILTFLSVFLLIKSIKLQSEELQNSSKALKHSASELELTRKEFQKQNDTSYQQLKTINYCNKQHGNNELRQPFLI
ncbi:MAG: hypothetical protein J0L67_00795 [Cytophagales bacterium]|nr:hypothetical protein [Cytophagales bacterium]